MRWLTRWWTRRQRDLAEPSRVDAAAIVRRARRLRFRIKPGAVSTLGGAYLGARPGVGLTFSELHAYEPGDDVRHLDWNVTARQGRPYVRRFVEERSLTFWLVVDISASLRFGLDGKTKADRAAQAAALLATAAIHNGDRVGLCLVTDRVEAEVPPGGGERHLARLIRALVATPAASRQTDLTVGISRLRRTTRRALVVVLSDFLLPSPAPNGLWRRAARRHEVIALRLVDPREEELPAAGLLAVEDTESGQHRLVPSSSRRVRARYAEAAVRRRAAFRSWCGATGVAGHDLSTEVDPIAPLTRIFAGRARAVGRGTT
ncbi:MAG: DUF58 domain-containing protein [Isosphaeraceae bacterium]